MKYNTIIINLYAGAGAGKSTLAALLYGNMKTKEIFSGVEMVQEFVKPYILSGQEQILLDQHFVTDGQISLMKPYIGNVPLLVTDSPLELGGVYADSFVQGEIREKIENFLSGTYDINIFVERVGSSYEQFGRVGSLQDSIEKDKEIKGMLIEEGKEFISYNREKETLADLMFEINSQIQRIRSGEIYGRTV